MIWHILKKDLRRLSLPVAVAIAMLCALTVLDAQRYDFEVSFAETVLNLLLPLAWSVLIASAVHLEPLTSDNAFWLTRPYRRHTLLTAKVLFAVLVVHLPLLVAHAALLVSHGFSPFATALLWKQALVVAAVTLPSLAIASATSTLAGFGWCALAAGVAALLLNASLVGRRLMWTNTDWMPGALALSVLVLGAAVIAMLQYARRFTTLARTAAMIVGLAAILVFSYVPRDFTAAMQCALEPNPATQFSLRFIPEERGREDVGWVAPDRVPLALPIRVDGVQPNRFLMVEQLRARVQSPAGDTWEARRVITPVPGARIAIGPDQRFATQYLLPAREFVRSVSGKPVRVEGVVTIQPLRMDEAIILPSVFEHRDIPGLGRCSSSLSAGMFGQQSLKVSCEAPGELPRRVPVTLLDPKTGTAYKHRLGEVTSHFIIPAMNWLSPLERQQTHIQIGDVHVMTSPFGNRLLVARDVVLRSTIRIEPAVPEGCARVSYSFDVPDLDRWVSPSAPRAAR